MVLRVLVALGWMLAVVLLPSTAWSATEPTPTASATTDPTPADPPADPPPADPSPSPAEPTATVTVTPSEPPPPTEAPGVNTGVYVDPGTGAVRMGEKSGVALGVGVWLASVLAGLATAWLVLP